MGPFPLLPLQETQGVCVATFGESREFPAFFSCQSGLQAPCRVQNEEEAAQMIGELSVGLRHGRMQDEVGLWWDLLCLSLYVRACFLSQVINAAVEQRSADCSALS